MKRRDLIRYLEDHGCEFFREGSKHTVYVNRAVGKSTTIPRHREINEHLARRICKDLDVPQP
ncbi:MAG: type II toxin-antitoxin system HicA family toxin [Candidatus Methylomirabilis oxyfera]|nr:type II toxin-antitoxin system HicA family toxin [Candidatus Methylomirabilis oxyfera]